MDNEETIENEKTPFLKKPLVRKTMIIAGVAAGFLISSAIISKFSDASEELTQEEFDSIEEASTTDTPE